MLLLAVVLDLAGPLVPEAMQHLGDFEEAIHGTRGRRPFRPMRDVAPPTVVRQIHKDSVQVSLRTADEPLRRPAPPRTARKTPPPGSEPAPAPEDH
jgi:hypothetical protein